MKNDLTQELGTNFIEYAVAVNTDRAIPNALDGLKPVAKRILWGAEDKTKCSSNKSAKDVKFLLRCQYIHSDWCNADFPMSGLPVTSFYDIL